MSRRRGSVFVFALAVIVVLTLVVVTAAERVRVEAQAMQNRIDRQRAERLAESGVAFALERLVEQDANVTTAEDLWVTLGDGGNETFTLGTGEFRIQVLDAGSFISLNNAPREQLENLSLTDEQIDSLLDWREAEFQPRAAGAKDEYYRALTNPYNARLAPFTTVEELLLVRGFTPDVLYEPSEDVIGEPLVDGPVEEQPVLSELLGVDALSSNVNSEGERKVNVNEAQTFQLQQQGISQELAQAIVNRRNGQGTFESMSEVLQVDGVTLENAETILNSLTVTNDQSVTGLINLNTASEAVLNSVPEFETDITQAVLGRQGTFAGLGELATIPGVSLEVLRASAGLFTVGSRRFLIRAEGIQGTQRAYLEAVAEIGENGVQIKKIRQPASDPARWGWPEEPSITTPALEAAL